MRNAFVLAIVLLVALAPTERAVAAQEAAGQFAPPEGAPPQINEGSLYSGPYEVTAEGDLVYGGDVRLRCEDLPKFASQASIVPAEPPPEEAFELCERAGFLPSRGEAAATNAPSQYERMPAAVLPSTGGPRPLPTAAAGLLALTGVLALVPSGTAKAVRLGQGARRSRCPR